MRSLPQAVSRRRLALGLTQEEVARRARITRKTLSSFETGPRLRVSLGTLARILAAVGLELAVREASRRPTLDELATRYAEPAEEPAPKRKRVRR